MNHKKLLKITLFFILCIISIIIGLFFGYKLGIGNQKDIITLPVSKQLDVKTIAIVNLDEGIVSDEGVVNYANDLIDYTNDNLVSTSLEDARNGVEEGRYAGYVIIPATFSKDIRSINETPVESQIQYAIGANLSGQAGLAAMSNIYLMMKNLNNNVSYMYVDSILNEFHLAQDGVDEILKNGKMVSDVVNEVTPEDISSRVDFPSEKQMEYQPGNIDFSSYTQNNMDLISDINKVYSDGYEKSKKEKEDLTAAANVLKEGISDTNSKLQDVNIEVDSEGNYVYDSELQQLSDCLKEYNTGLDASTGTIKEKIKTANKVLKESETKIEDIETCYSDTVDKYNDALINAINMLNGELTEGKYTLDLQQQELEQCTKDGAIIEGLLVVTYSEENKKEYRLVKENGAVDTEAIYTLLKDVIANEKIRYKSKNGKRITNVDEILEQLNSIIPQYGKDRVYKKDENGNYIEQEVSIISNLTKLEKEITAQRTILEALENNEILQVDTEQIIQNVKENVVDKLSDNAKNIAKSISDEYEKETENLTAFQVGITDYDPFAYINQDLLKEKYSALNVSTSGLEEIIRKKDSEDMEAMNTIYSQYSENIMLLRDSVSSAVDASNKLVEDGLKEAKDTLSEKNNRNEELLGNFAQKLQYTRNGSLGNYRVYQFIVDPFEERDVSPESSELLQEEIVSKPRNTISKSAVVYGVATVAGILVLAIVLMILIKKKQKKNDNYNL
ncbi:MAG: hypothetical protein K2K56_09130 [Lachnospiraceae bacterium]|nr:hypothetical protein [Lachnospiraceae bacterium]